jgi:hypothetical protein
MLESKDHCQNPDNRHFRDYPVTGNAAGMPKSTRMTHFGSRRPRDTFRSTGLGAFVPFEQLVTVASPPLPRHGL